MRSFEIFYSKEQLVYLRIQAAIYLAIALSFPLQSAFAEQFVLYDKVFTFEKEDAVPTKSHLKLSADELSKDTPEDWTSPVNYIDGTVYVYMEVLEKPKGDAETYWSLCYRANQGQNGAAYACTGSPRYTATGTYERVNDMKTIFQRDKVVWSKGLKGVSLVTKASNSKVKGKSHAHLQPDISKYFPTKIRVIMVQVSKDGKLDRSKISGLKRLNK